jgi:hypothetical protein
MARAGAPDALSSDWAFEWLELLYGRNAEALLPKNVDLVRRTQESGMTGQPTGSVDAH